MGHPFHLDRADIAKERGRPLQPAHLGRGDGRDGRSLSTTPERPGGWSTPETPAGVSNRTKNRKRG